MLEGKIVFNSKIGLLRHGETSPHNDSESSVYLKLCEAIYLLLK
jgi:hypothetical protein